MTPSKQAKAAGLKSLAEFSKISDVSTRTLENWHKRNPQRFAVMLAGAVDSQLKKTSAVLCANCGAIYWEEVSACDCEVGVIQKWEKVVVVQAK